MRLSDRRKKKVTFHNWVSNRSDWQPFLHMPTSPPKSNKKKKNSKHVLQSLPLMARYGEKLDASVIFTQHPLS